MGDMKCARIVRRRLGGRCKSTQKSESHKTKEECDAAGNCEWSGCMYANFGCSFSNSDSSKLEDHEFECRHYPKPGADIKSKLTLTEKLCVNGGTGPQVKTNTGTTKCRRLSFK